MKIFKINTKIGGKCFNNQQINTNIKKKNKMKKQLKTAWMKLDFRFLIIDQCINKFIFSLLSLCVTSKQKISKEKGIIKNLIDKEKKMMRIKFVYCLSRRNHTNDG